MKQFNLNKIKVAHLKDANVIVGGTDTNNIVYTDNLKFCKTEECSSANAYICPNTTISGEQTTRPIDTEPK